MSTKGLATQWPKPRVPRERAAATGGVRVLRLIMEKIINLDIDLWRLSLCNKYLNKMIKFDTASKIRIVFEANYKIISSVFGFNPVKISIGHSATIYGREYVVIEFINLTMLSFDRMKGKIKNSMPIGIWKNETGSLGFNFNNSGRIEGRQIITNNLGNINNVDVNYSNKQKIKITYDLKIKCLFHVTCTYQKGYSDYNKRRKYKAVCRCESHLDSTINMINVGNNLCILIYHSPTNTITSVPFPQNHGHDAFRTPYNYEYMVEFYDVIYKSHHNNTE